MTCCPQSFLFLHVHAWLVLCFCLTEMYYQRIWSEMQIYFKSGNLWWRFRIKKNRERVSHLLLALRCVRSIVHECKSSIALTPLVILTSELPVVQRSSVQKEETASDCCFVSREVSFLKTCSKEAVKRKEVRVVAWGWSWRQESVIWLPLEWFLMIPQESESLLLFFLLSLWTIITKLNLMIIFSLMSCCLWTSGHRCRGVLKRRESSSSVWFTCDAWTRRVLSTSTRITVCCRLSRQ
jgi:hypothetical protein